MADMLVIGAGPLGLACAKALKEAAIPYVQVEATDHVGGNWAHGVYETAHIISSRKTTEYPDWPMPDDYPDFPSKQQMEAYYNAFADTFGLREHIEFEATVTAVRPRPDQRWDVTIQTAAGAPDERVYGGVLVCNGHHWDKCFPPWTDAYEGELIHSKDYKVPAQLEGKRVLVLGGGNSGCDLASEAARVADACDWSLRRGYHFLPKTLFGVPSVELVHPWAPVWLQRIITGLLRRVVVGKYTDYGLPKPDHKLFEAHPTVNSEVFHYLKHGRIQPRPDVVETRGDVVVFTDGTEATYDLVVCATGYHVTIPFLPEGLVPVAGKTAQTIGGALVPGRKNLFVVGTSQVRYGIGPLIRPYAVLIADWIKMQADMTLPLADVLVAMGAKPPTTHLVDPHQALRQLKVARWMGPKIVRKERRMRKRLGGGGGAASEALSPPPDARPSGT